MSGRILRGAAAAAANGRHALGTLAALAVMAAPPAVASPLGPEKDHWRPNATIGVLDHVTLRIHWYESMGALREAAIERNVTVRYLQGFSILRRNTETGEYVCDVHVLRMGGALVDTDRTVTFGHEVLHCFGLGHD